MSAVARPLLWLGLLWAGWVEPCWAHDPSTYGGLFRSRNFGETWLNADAGLFVNAALAVAVDPHDPHHLLLGTDTGLLSTRNGGRTWKTEAAAAIFGPVLAVGFGPGSTDALCVAPTGVFRLQAGAWVRVAVSEGAAPARALTFSRAGRAYLLGAGGLFVSDDGAQSFRQLPAIRSEGGLTAIAAVSALTDTLLTVANRQLMISRDGGRTWGPQAIAGSAKPVDTVAADPGVVERLWAGSADRVYVSDDGGVSWEPVGNPLPEAETNIRGVAGDPSKTTLVLTTHRGLYRSTNGGLSWTLKEGSLPIHLEAGPLVRDPGDTQTLYAVYSLMPYPEVWRTAISGGNLLSRINGISLAGGLAFVLLLMIGGVILVGWLVRLRAARPWVRGSTP